MPPVPPLFLRLCLRVFNYEIYTLDIHQRSHLAKQDDKNDTKGPKNHKNLLAAGSATIQRQKSK